MSDYDFEAADSDIFGDVEDNPFAAVDTVNDESAREFIENLQKMSEILEHMTCIQRHVVRIAQLSDKTVQAIVEDFYLGTKDATEQGAIPEDWKPWEDHPEAFGL
jgi:hypothetical protein